VGVFSGKGTQERQFWERGGEKVQTGRKGDVGGRKISSVIWKVVGASGETRGWVGKHKRTNKRKDQSSDSPKKNIG